MRGEGRVKVTLSPDDGCEELTAIEFLDENAITGNLGWLAPFGGETHEIVVKKGSVLRLGP